MHRQRPVKGGRLPLPSCVLKEIRREVERLARTYNVSRSFVIATTLADAFGVQVEERYDEVDNRKRKPLRRIA